MSNHLRNICKPGNLLHRHPWVHTFAFINFWCFQNGEIHFNNQWTRSLRVSHSMVWECYPPSDPPLSLLFSLCSFTTGDFAQRSTRGLRLWSGCRRCSAVEKPAVYKHNVCLPTRLFLSLKHFTPQRAKAAQRTDTSKAKMWSIYLDIQTAGSSEIGA